MANYRCQSLMHYTLLNFHAIRGELLSECMQTYSTQQFALITQIWLHMSFLSSFVIQTITYLPGTGIIYALEGLTHWTAYFEHFLLSNFLNWSKGMVCIK